VSSMTSKKVVLVTGASSGIGRACAAHLASKGYKVYGTSRHSSPDNSAPDDAVEMIQMDVRDDAAVTAAVRHVIQESHRIDILINCAGIVYAGSVEDMSIEEYQHQFDTNYFGVIRVTKSVLPYMRAQADGVIVNVGSIAGFMGLPFQSAYCASKAALEMFTESLRIEVKPYGIRSLVLQLGDYKTEVINNRLFSEKANADSVYFPAFSSAMKVSINGEETGASPEVLAKKIESLIRRKNPKIRYTRGKISQRLAAKLKYWVPSRLVERLIIAEYR